MAAYTEIVGLFLRLIFIGYTQLSVQTLCQQPTVLIALADYASSFFAHQRSKAFRQRGRWRIGQELMKSRAGGARKKAHVASLPHS